MCGSSASFASLKGACPRRGLGLKICCCCVSWADIYRIVFSRLLLLGVGPTVNSSVCAPIVGQDRSKKREASVRRCKALVQALVDVQLGLDEGNSAVPAGSGR